MVRKLMEDYSRDRHQHGGYEFVYSPNIATLHAVGDQRPPRLVTPTPCTRPWSWRTASYYPKPMNCPFHMLIFRSSQRRYRELPLRLFELGTVYRYERSGVLHGLMRIRGFTQDDSHIFCTRDQIQDELVSLLELRDLGPVARSASTTSRPASRPSPRARPWAADEEWDEATEALRLALEKKGLEYDVDEGGGAFYGPKIDVHVQDAIGRRWQLSTLQVRLPAARALRPRVHRSPTTSPTA